jgi:hypothetical protein
VHSGAPECEMSMHYFSYSGGAGTVSTKKRIRTHYAELVFLHLVGSVGHIVHCSVSGVRNTDALFVMLGWDQYGFDKKHIRTRYAKLVFLHPVGSTGHLVHFDFPRA